MMYLPKIRPGEQVVLIPDWVYKTLANRGRVESLINFKLMRQWFSQEQLVAMNQFSKSGLDALWSASVLQQSDGSSANDKYLKSLSYLWFFPEEAGQSQNGTEADEYAKDSLSSLSDNLEYAAKMNKEHILDHLMQPPANKLDILQSYSVYSGSDKLIVLVFNQGIFHPVLHNRKQEVRLAILRDVVKKLEDYHRFNGAAKSDWFSWYLAELDAMK